MLKDHNKSVFQLIEDSWNSSVAWPDQTSAMRLAIPDRSEDTDTFDNPGRWVVLPGLCCQAAGGKLEVTREISAAWLLLYTAAHIVDTVEDGDYDPRVSRLGDRGVVINTANGLFLSAFMHLQSMDEQGIPQDLAAEITTDYLETILTMIGGQHLDLTIPQLDLHQWWQIAQAKSGAFFSLACRTGARLGTSDSDKIEAYSDFGCHLGLLLQIFDDMQDYQTLLESKETNPSLNLEKSLAAAYAYDVLPESAREEFTRLAKSDATQNKIADKLMNILDECGAGLYMVSEIHKHYGLGKASLEKGHPISPAGEQLESILDAFTLNQFPAP